MNRVRPFQEKLKAHGFDAALLHRPENMRYLTGYTGEGAVFVGERGAVVITDFRYVEQVSRQSPEAALAQTGAQHPESACLRELTDAQGIRSLAVETDFLSHDDFEALQAAFPFVKLEKLSGLPEEMRLVKDEGEIACIRRAAEISCKAFENLLGKMHAGMTEKQVQILLDFEMLSLGSEGNAFDTISAAGVNGSLPHAIPSDHVIQNGELLTLDFGARYGGYDADMTRTVGFGKISPELRTLYQTVSDAQLAALDAVAPGKICGDIDRIARDIIDARYPGAFGHSLGHGVGLFIHEQPRVSPGSQTVLVPGHVITIEPGVYIPGLGGCRIEDMAILTSDGYIDPITAPKHLIEL